MATRRKVVELPNPFAAFFLATFTTKCEPKGCTFEGLLDPQVKAQWDVHFHEIDWECPTHGFVKLFSYQVKEVPSE